MTNITMIFGLGPSLANGAANRARQNNLGPFHFLGIALIQFATFFCLAFCCHICGRFVSLGCQMYIHLHDCSIFVQNVSAEVEDSSTGTHKTNTFVHGSIQVQLTVQLMRITVSRGLKKLPIKMVVSCNFYLVSSSITIVFLSFSVTGQVTCIPRPYQDQKEHT